MRHAVSLGLILAVCTSAVAAQGRQIGAKAGPNFSMVVFDPDQGDEDYDQRVAAAGGGFFVLPVTRRIGLQLEALFNPKGAKLYDAAEELTGTVLLRYFEIPMLVRINGPRSASRAFHFFAGPYSAFRMSATREISFAAGGVTAGEKTDMSDEVERFEFGMLGGAGVDVGKHVVIDGRYSHALTDLNTDSSDGVRIRNKMFTVMAGVRF
jgi:hypothetical protein